MFQAAAGYRRSLALVGVTSVTAICALKPLELQAAAAQTQAEPHTWKESKIGHYGKVSG
jgi:hypothetical protein